MNANQREAVIQLARQNYAEPSNDDIEIDDKPTLAMSDDGTWVQAWVWVSDEDVKTKG